MADPVVENVMECIREAAEGMTDSEHLLFVRDVLDAVSAYLRDLERFDRSGVTS